MSTSQPRSRLTSKEHEKRSLDLVQRVIISALVGVVFGSFAASLAAYLAVYGDQDLPPASVTGLWIMTGVMGLLTAVAILMVNRRRPYSPWVLLGLLPMAVLRSLDLQLTLHVHWAFDKAEPLSAATTDPDWPVNSLRRCR